MFGYKNPIVEACHLIGKRATDLHLVGRELPKWQSALFAGPLAVAIVLAGDDLPGTFERALFAVEIVIAMSLPAFQAGYLATDEP